MVRRSEEALQRSSRVPSSPVVPPRVPSSPVAVAPLPSVGVLARVRRFDGRATESFESLNDQNFVKILSEFGKFCQNPSKIVKFEES